MRIAGRLLGSLKGYLVVWPVLAAALCLGVQAAGAAGLGLEGRVAVGRLEMAYLPEDGLLRVRAHLVSGMAVDYETSSEAAIRTLLDMAEVVGGGRARLYVELQKDRIRSFQLEVGQGADTGLLRPLGGGGS